MSSRFCDGLTVTAPAGAEVGPSSTEAVPHTLAMGASGAGEDGVEPAADAPAAGVCAPLSPSPVRRTAVTAAPAARTSAQATTTALSRYHARCSMLLLIRGAGG